MFVIRSLLYNNPLMVQLAEKHGLSSKLAKWVRKKVDDCQLMIAQETAVLHNRFALYDSWDDDINCSWLLILIGCEDFVANM